MDFVTAKQFLTLVTPLLASLALQSTLDYELLRHVRNVAQEKQK